MTDGAWPDLFYRPRTGRPTTRRASRKLSASRTRSRAIPLAAAVATILSCGGGDESLGPDEYHRVEGWYTGPVEGPTSIGTFVAFLHLDLRQSAGGTLEGRYHYWGEIHDARYDRAYDFSGSGSLAGTLEPGSSPRLTLTITREGCPDISMEHAGSYDPGRRQISMTGNLELVKSFCDVLSSVPHTTVFTKS